MNNREAAATIERVMRKLATKDRHVTSDRQARWVEWIDCARALGLEVEIVEDPIALLGTRLCIRSDPSERSLWGVASSRLTRKLEGWASWFAALRMICSTIDQSSAALLVFAGTTADVYATRAAELFGCAVVRASVSAADRCFESWMDGISSVQPQEMAAGKLSLSPPLDPQALAHSVATVSDRDRCLAALSDHLLALYVRRGGNVEQLMKWRLQSGGQSHTTRLVIGPNLTEARVRDDLLSRWGRGLVFVLHVSRRSDGRDEFPTATIRSRDQPWHGDRASGASGGCGIRMGLPDTLHPAASGTVAGSIAGGLC